MHSEIGWVSLFILAFFMHSEIGWLSLFIPALGIGAQFIVARTSGWSRLAGKYACRDSFLGTWKGWQWAHFNGCSYKGCMWIGIAPDGLHLQTGPAFFFALFHPPLRIPWSVIKSVEPGTYWFTKTIKVELLSGEKFMLKRNVLNDAERFLGEKMKLSGALPANG